MGRSLSIFLFVLLLPALSVCQSIPSEFLSGPTLLELDKPTVEVKAGSTVNYTVVLKNTRGQPVAAPIDIQVELQTPSGDRTIEIQAGRSSANFTWTATNPGVAHMTVRSGNLRPSTGLILVTPSGTAPLGPGRRSPASVQPPQLTPKPSPKGPPAPEPSAGIITKGIPAGADAPGTTGALTQSIAGVPAASAATQKIALFVTPVPVLGDAISHVWKANITVELLEGGALVPASGDVRVDFHSDFGHLSAPSVIIQRGEYSSFNNAVVLTADRTGTDHVLALSTLGPAGPIDVEYLLPPPTQLRLSLGAPAISGTGTSTASVTVCLLDEAENLTYFSSQDTQVTLNANGQLSSSRVTILSGKSCSDLIAWTSPAGAAIIIAEAGGLKSDSKSLKFPPFPWYLVWLAAGGGLVGALVSHPSDFSSRWLAHTWRGLLLGAILGAIFFLFARYGAIALPEASPVNVQKIPVVSSLGALLLGFLGGLYGRKLWRIQEGPGSPTSSKPSAAAKATPKTQ